ncbi:MAG: right-handed parallel beta-helix repeat-containing protein [Betaproteobacteria bacterium]|nr:right-handed parallel beta-helix repeat-containing protein [Betaproteobacteria bacterium]
MRRTSALFLAALLVCGITAQAPGREADEAPDHIGPRTEAVSPERYARVLHVSQTSGSDEIGDGSEQRPWKTIGQALAKVSATANSSRAALLVGAGAYGEPLQMRPNIDLYGGFDPSTWERDIIAHATVLDGQSARRVVVGASDARIDGFVIRGGRVQAPGAGILCDRASPTITNNTITGNATLEPAGYIHALMHQVGNDGGGIACVNGAAPIIANNLISGNSTGVGGGGGIATSNYAAPIILNNVLCDNLTGATDRNQSRSSNGAAISCVNLPMKVQAGDTSRKRIANNVILNNRVSGRSDAGGIYCDYDASPEIAGNFILGNTAEDDGGAIYVMKSSEPAIRGNVIAGNTGGGAIRLSKEGRAWIENNLLFANSTGGVTCNRSWMTLKNNTIVNNTGNGMAYENDTRHLQPSVASSNIFFGNVDNKIRIQSKFSPPMAITHSLVQGGYKGEGNINADPQFIDDGCVLPVAAVEFDEARYQTRLTLGEEIGPKLSGRVVRMGSRWGVVHECGSKNLVVWGDLRGPGGAHGARKFEILPTYRLSAGSPCIGAGRHGTNIGSDQRMRKN